MRYFTKEIYQLWLQEGWDNPKVKQAAELRKQAYEKDKDKMPADVQKVWRLCLPDSSFESFTFNGDTLTAKFIDGNMSCFVYMDIEFIFYGVSEYENTEKWQNMIAEAEIYMNSSGKFVMDFLTTNENEIHICFSDFKLAVHRHEDYLKRMVYEATPVGYKEKMQCLRQQRPEIFTGEPEDDELYLPEEEMLIDNAGNNIQLLCKYVGFENMHPAERELLVVLQATPILMDIDLEYLSETYSEIAFAFGGYTAEKIELFQKTIHKITFPDWYSAILDKACACILHGCNEKSPQLFMLDKELGKAYQEHDDNREVIEKALAEYIKQCSAINF